MLQRFRVLVYRVSITQSRGPAIVPNWMSSKGFFPVYSSFVAVNAAFEWPRKF